MMKICTALEDFFACERFLLDCGVGNLGVMSSGIMEQYADGSIKSACLLSGRSSTNVFVSIATVGVMGYEFLYHAFEAAFAGGTRRITALVSEDNEASLNFARSLGFTEEHRIFEMWEVGKHAVMLSLPRDTYYASELYTRLREHVMSMPTIEPTGQTYIYATQRSI